MLQFAVRDIIEVGEADLWVMKPSVETLDQPDAMTELAVNRVRSVPGVAWAAPYYQAIGQLRTRDGRAKLVQVIGVDDASFVAAPRAMLIGSLDDLRRPDAVVVDVAGFATLFPDLEPQTGLEFEVGRRRAVVVGVCRVGPSWNALPRIYTRRSLAVEYARETQNPVTYVLARSEAGERVETVARRITAETGLVARSRDGFIAQTQGWIMRFSGVAENFGITIFMGVVIGVAIVGQTFYMFSIENLRQFAALKAIGFDNTGILGIVSTQAVFVAVVGFCLGIGAASLFFAVFGPQLTGGMRGMFMHPAIFVGAGVFILAITLLSCLLSVRKVITADPGLVFRG